ncbi:MAG: hypothetical protein P8100_07990 [bacterium]|jgi:hypothetical protein
MKTMFTSFILLLAILISPQINAQDYSFEDFVGTWNGTISSQSFEPYEDPITMIIEPDGFYTETSGHLMPTIYPNTQECDFDEESNRMHWWYLNLVYAGQYFYQHFFYEVVYFQNDTLEMHYNFWDDPEPHPEVGTLILVRQTTVSVAENLPDRAPQKELIRVLDLNGRERPADTRGELLIFQFSDGTVEKKFIL